MQFYTVLAGVVGFVIGMALAFPATIALVEKSNVIGRAMKTTGEFGTKTEILKAEDDIDPLDPHMAPQNCTGILKERRRQFRGGVTETYGGVEYWYCTKCWRRNSGDVCSQCGTPRTVQSAELR